MRLTGLAPVVYPDSKVLLLGTFPSVKSLEKGEYYGNPVNGFWRILCGALEVSPVPDTYEEKKRLLKRHGIALWDVFGACERKGSADHAIQNYEVNDIPGFLKKRPKIRRVILESRTAEKIWKKHWEKTSPVPGFYVPSPSSLARMSLAEKVRLWRMVLRG